MAFDPNGFFIVSGGFQQKWFESVIRCDECSNFSSITWLFWIFWGIQISRILNVHVTIYTKWRKCRYIYGRINWEHVLTNSIIKNLQIKYKIRKVWDAKRDNQQSDHFSLASIYWHVTCQWKDQVRDLVLAISGNKRL